MGLTGKRVMIVEDEFLLALSLEEDLMTAGAIVVGPFATLPEAMQAIDKESFDVAILDINLNGEMSYPAADALIERGAPFILLSGYAATGLPERFRAFRQLPKPYDVARLIEALQAIETV
jgi:DNA-binding NtrC family response regulator